MKQIILDGQKFKSKKAAAKHYGVGYGNLLLRLREGWTTEEAFGIKHRECRGIEVVIGEKKFAKTNGVGKCIAA